MASSPMSPLAIHRTGLSGHPSPVPGVLPSLDYLEWNVICDVEHRHMFWRERRGKRGHNTRGEATLKWSTEATHKNDFVSMGKYTVARLFIEHLIGPIEKHTHFLCLCGLPQCVNPHHWGRQARLPRHRLELRRDMWQVVSGARAVVISAPVVVRVRDLAGVTHVARAAPPDPLIAMCGQRLDVATSLIVESIVTCRGGC